MSRLRSTTTSHLLHTTDGGWNLSLVDCSSATEEKKKEEKKDTEELVTLQIPEIYLAMNLPVHCLIILHHGAYAL